MSQIAIIDYGMGNLRSVYQALEHVSDDTTTITVTADKQTILDADRIVFPGQGAARDCMRELKNHDLLEIIPQVAKEKPFLGICMGMQVLMERSAENDGINCLGIYRGSVNNFAQVHAQREDQRERLKIPQMGWNQINQCTDHPLWHDIENNTRFYFVHSYYVQPKDSSLCTGMTDYGLDYASAIAQDTIFAIQAHPEKSSDDGLQLLKNFTQWDGA
ncbi:MAG: imidazole glycerol phosphate synthase subunit HisH [Thiotrichaceae bacterium]|nr:imidazole glycerol phosphate synthase subunit HisH [Thiotrichaceae bacterium]